MTALALNPSAFAPVSAMRAALALASRIVERRNTIPVLSNVLMRATDDGAAIVGTDLDMQLTARIPGAIADAGFIATFPAHFAYDLTRKAASDDVTITLRDNAEFDFGGARTALQTLPESDFPDLAFTGTVNAEFDADADAFRLALERTAFAISTDETRYYLNGVYLHTATVDGARVWRMVSTDGHRLARHDLMPAGDAAEIGVIIPRKTVSVLLHMLKPVYEGKGKSKVRTSPETVKVTVNCTRIKFTFGDLELVSKLVDGTFPDYGRVIPRANAKRLTVDARSMAGLIDRVSTVSSERGRAVKLEMDEGMLMASVRNPDAGWSSDMIECEYDGAPLEIGFNARYVLDILEHIEGAATIKLDEAGTPTLFHGADARTLYVLMPIRV